MKFFQTSFINYILVILLTFAGTWYFISGDKNKLVSASEKSIGSVVTISSVSNASLSNNRDEVGSGVIFSNDGYIVTNLHILSSQNISVKLDNGKKYMASIIGIDKNTDIAVLKISSNEELKDYYINQTNQQFNSINDYKVDMIIRLEIPAFRMPKKKYKVFYKQPDKIKVKARGFGILPKTGLSLIEGTCLFQVNSWKNIFSPCDLIMPLEGFFNLKQ